jgi:hexosaminidase
LEKTYAYEPIPEGLSPENHIRILGLQAQLWTEYMQTPSQVEYMAFPRLAALAEVGWSSLKVRDYDSFLTRLTSHVKRLDVLETRYRPVFNCRTEKPA